MLWIQGAAVAVTVVIAIAAGTLVMVRSVARLDEKVIDALDRLKTLEDRFFDHILHSQPQDDDG